MSDLGWQPALILVLAIFVALIALYCWVADFFGADDDKGDWDHEAERKRRIAERGQKTRMGTRDFPNNRRRA